MTSFRGPIVIELFRNPILVGDECAEPVQAGPGSALSSTSRDCSHSGTE